MKTRVIIGVLVGTLGIIAGLVVGVMGIIVPIKTVASHLDANTLTAGIVANNLVFFILKELAATVITLSMYILGFSIITSGKP